jgi:hypothetical protein
MLFSIHAFEILTARDITQPNRWNHRSNSSKRLGKLWGVRFETDSLLKSKNSFITSRVRMKQKHLMSQILTFLNQVRQLTLFPAFPARMPKVPGQSQSDIAAAKSKNEKLFHFREAFGPFRESRTIQQGMDASSRPEADAAAGPGSLAALGSSCFSLIHPIFWMQNLV